MCQKTRPTLIGAFVVGALILLVIGVVAFGSGQLFKHQKEFILYFDGSVNGLRIGAPVKLKGVEIGSVKDIRLQVENRMPVHKIPVIIQIDLEKLSSRGAPLAPAMDPAAFKEMIDQGLRGQLQMESLVTGVLYVGLDLFPGAAINLVQKPDGDHKYQEIPTVPTELEQAQDAVTRIVGKLEAMDFKRLIDSLTKTSDDVGQLANSPKLKSILQSLDEAMPQVRAALLDFRNLTTVVNTNVEKVSGDLHQTLTAAHNTIEQISETVKEARAVIESVRGTIDPNSPALYELTKSLLEVSMAASSIRLLADSLDRNPQAVILGIPKPVSDSESRN